MIISHKYKYIFIKPKKIAGTSIEVALSKHLGKDDTMPPLTRYSKIHDKDQYSIRPRNYKGYYDHLSPDKIRKRIGERIWEKYLKFTVVRNPWDLVVSSYWWEVNKKVSLKDYLSVINLRALLDYAKDAQKIKRPRNFTVFVKNIPKVYINTNYYFHPNGKPIADLYIRYEKLDSDFKKVCKKLEIPHERLLSLKSKTRKSRKHYSKYYKKGTKKIVADIFKKEIEYFNYIF